MIPIACNASTEIIVVFLELIGGSVTTGGGCKQKNNEMWFCVCIVFCLWCAGVLTCLLLQPAVALIDVSQTFPERQVAVNLAWEFVKHLWNGEICYLRPESW